MGNYTGVATRLRVKKTAQKQLLDFLDFLYQTGSDQTEQPQPQDQEQADLNESIATVSRMIVNGSAYFETWEWRVKEDKDDFWLYESRASTTDCDTEVFISLLNGIRENLVLEEGDILLRCVYEDSCMERIIYLSNSEIKEDRGFAFKDDHGYVGDSRHPYRHERSKDEDPWDSGVRHSDDCTLPWKFEELMALNAVEQKQKDADWHPWN